jgi:hypothetical protein
MHPFDATPSCPSFPVEQGMNPEESRVIAYRAFLRFRGEKNQQNKISSKNTRNRCPCPRLYEKFYIYKPKLLSLPGLAAVRVIRIH